ncbi:MAG: family 10 glycosylhydrolase [Bacillota bacterium]
MKKINKNKTVVLTLLVAMVLHLMCVCVSAATDFRGAWITTVYSLDFPSTQNDVEGQKAEFATKLDELKDIGITSVFVQVRPKADAFYESELNPWSSVLTGEQGKYPGYDVMEYMIEETHERGMEFHAWLNPYRVTTSGTDVSELFADHIARKNPDWLITHENALYFNPELQEVKDYIAATVEEIVQNYDVDGIHFDDYFYPSNYALPEGEDGDGAVANARRQHINDMVKLTYDTVKKTDNTVVFGVSPSGIWKNDTSDSNGSQTRGYEAYYGVYADALAWISGGYIDYIAPQIYWEIGYEYADYETLVKWWAEQVKNTEVDFYVGHGIYKDVVAEEIVEQVNISERYNAGGSIFYCMSDLLNDRKNCGTALKSYYNIAVGEPDVAVEEELDAEPDVDLPVVVEYKNATVTTANITVDGVAVPLQAYTIEGFTYFKLRDIAIVVNGTQKQFDVTWDGTRKVIQLLPQTPYSDMLSIENEAVENTTAVTSTAQLLVGDIEERMEAYTMNGYTYYKLRDLGTALNIGITWDQDSQTIGIDTTVGYQEN